MQLKGSLRLRGRRASERQRLQRPQIDDYRRHVLVVDVVVPAKPSAVSATNRTAAIGQNRSWCDAPYSALGCGSSPMRRGTRARPRLTFFEGGRVYDLLLAELSRAMLQPPQARSAARVVAHRRRRAPVTLG
jgi:hypothetical protein